MVIYKLKKLFKERGIEIVKTVLMLSFACSSSFLIVLPMMITDDIEWQDKKKMIVFFLIAGVVNILSLLYIDAYDINIILKIVLSILISFFIFIPIIFILITISDYKDLKLDVSEQRDAKLEGLLRGRKWKKK